MKKTWEQVLTVQRSKNTILAVEETTSTEKCGTFLAAIFNALCQIVFLRLGTGLFCLLSKFEWLEFIRKHLKWRTV